MNKENKQYDELNNLLQDFYETNDWLDEEQVNKFIEHLSVFCKQKECRCRPNYHEVARFVMDNWTKDNDGLDYFIEALEVIENEQRAFLLESTNYELVSFLKNNCCSSSCYETSNCNCNASVTCLRSTC